MCLLLRLPTGRQLTKAVMAAKLSNLGIKRQKSFTFANGDCSGGVALLLYPWKGWSNLCYFAFLSLLSVRLEMAVAISVMVGLLPLPDPGKPRKQLCHTSIKVRNSELGFTTTIYSSNNNNHHTFFSKFWHNSRVYRVQQIPARGSFLGSSKCCVLASH